MKKNLIFAILLLAILANGWSIAFLTLPFYKTSLVIGGLSMIIMTVVHERFVFLLAMIVTLSYGAFLTGYSFVYQQSAEMQLLYAYDHLLLTSLMILYWVMLNFLKKVGYENTELKQQVKLLQKYRGVTKVLTLTEFEEQAQWLLNSSQRNKEQTWFVEIDINYTNKRMKDILQEDLEHLALQTIRQKFDLITSSNGVIYILLKNTHSEGVQRVLDRFHEKVQTDLNFVDPPFTSLKVQIEDANHLTSLVEAT